MCLVRPVYWCLVCILWNHISSCWTTNVSTAPTLLSALVLLVIFINYSEFMGQNTSQHPRLRQVVPQASPTDRPIFLSALPPTPKARTITHQMSCPRHLHLRCRRNRRPPPRISISICCSCPYATPICISDSTCRSTLL